MQPTFDTTEPNVKNLRKKASKLPKVRRTVKKLAHIPSGNLTHGFERLRPPPCGHLAPRNRPSFRAVAAQEPGPSRRSEDQTAASLVTAPTPEGRDYRRPSRIPQLLPLDLPSVQAIDIERIPPEPQFHSERAPRSGVLFPPIYNSGALSSYPSDYLDCPRRLLRSHSAQSVASYGSTSESTTSFSTSSSSPPDESSYLSEEIPVSFLPTSLLWSPALEQTNFHFSNTLDFQSLPQLDGCPPLENYGTVILSDAQESHSSSYNPDPYRLIPQGNGQGYEDYLTSFVPVSPFDFPTNGEDHNHADYSNHSQDFASEVDSHSPSQLNPTNPLTSFVDVSPPSADALYPHQIGSETYLDWGESQSNFFPGQVQADRSNEPSYTHNLEPECSTSDIMVDLVS